MIDMSGVWTMGRLGRFIVLLPGSNHHKLCVMNDSNKTLAHITRHPPPVQSSVKVLETETARSG